jgi:hypothetical protein
MLRFIAFAALLLPLSLDQAAAQPSQAQRDAIRAACRSDFIANCSSVQPDGKEAFECLLRNDAKLSASCRTAVNAAAPKPAQPAAAAAPSPATAVPVPSETAPPATKAERAPPGIQVAPAETQNEQLKAVQQACTLNDFVAHCSWIAPNNPEILLCLKGNAADLSPNCQAAVQSLPASPPAAAAPSPAAAEPARQAAPAKKPAEPKPPEPARASRRGGAHGSAESRHPRVVPVRFHVPLRRRAARRRRSAAMSQAQRSATVDGVSQRRGGDWRRRRRRWWCPAPQPHPEHRRRPRRRSPPSGRCRRCARARRWRSCKFAARKCGRSAPASRSAAAVSSLVLPPTHLVCRPAVTAR